MGAQGITNLLFGIVNPSGKLPNQWVKHVGHIGSGSSPWLQQRVSLFGGPSTGAEERKYGSYLNDDYSPYKPGSNLGYAAPLFYFGYGLSYSTFTLTSLQIQVDESNFTYPVQVMINIQNNGPFIGSTVIQIYVQDPIGATLNVRPWKRLIGFQRVNNLTINETRSIIVNIRSDDLGYIGDDYTLNVFKGQYTLSVGQSSIDDNAPGMIQTFTIQNTRQLMGK